MTNGSSLFKQLLPIVSALLFSSAAFSLFLISSSNSFWMTISFAVVFIIPSISLAYFILQARKAASERDNMRLMLESRALDTSSNQGGISSDLSHELTKTRQICEQLSNGDFEARITNIREDSALCEIQWAINELVDRTDAFMREAAASMDNVAHQKYYRRVLDKDMSGAFKRTASIINSCTHSFAKRSVEFETVVQQFENDIGSVARLVHETSDSLQQSANKLSGNAEDTALQVDKVTNAAVSASSSVETVSSSAKEMSTSIQEIGKQVQQSKTNANTASEMANSGNIKIRGLSEAAQSIGEVVRLIEDIASQTNLLALNATIEAARAGEAGRGFAVVANEVKNLASQTAKATEDISRQIVEIQGATAEAVQSMETINSTVEDINQSVTAIAGAVELQDSATREISENVQNASQNTTSVSETIRQVQSSAEETSQTSASLLQEANVLQKQSVGLEKNVEVFLTKVRSIV